LLQVTLRKFINLGGKGMRTTVVLVIVLLTLGLYSVPALAGDNAVIQPLPASCQPVSDVELSQMRGKQLTNFNGCAQALLCEKVKWIWDNKVPVPVKQSWVGQKLVSVYQQYCHTNNTNGNQH
jgi:hypothetical protein